MKSYTREYGLALAVIICSTLQARVVSKIDQPANAATGSVHEEAVRILNSIHTTKYQHKPDIDEKKGAYYCDCSGFVGYVLSRTVGKEDGKGPLHNGRKWPTAMEYEKFFAAATINAAGDGRWQHIDWLTDARPGDVIAWRHEKPKAGNTGHVVIVDQTPIVEKDGVVRVAVIDSTTLPSIDLTGDKGKTGIGRRTMWFTVDKDGRPHGYIRGSRKAKPKVEAIAIGRALPGAKSGSEKHATRGRAA
jgi:hypothetical protein